MPVCKKILNYPLILNNLNQKKKEIEMENGSSYKIGLNVLLHVEEDKCSYKEYANHPLEMVLNVNLVLIFLLKIVMKNLAQIGILMMKLKLQPKLELQLLELKKFLTDHKDMNFVN